MKHHLAANKYATEVPRSLTLAGPCLQFIILMRSVESPVWLEHHGAHSQAQANRARLLREANNNFPDELPLQLDSGAIQVEPLLPTIQEVRPLPCCEYPLNTNAATVLSWPA